MLPEQTGERSIMKKLIAVLLVLLIIMPQAGCLGGHRITVTKGKELLDTCPRSAKEGETVTVQTMVITEGYVIIKVDGVTYKEEGPGTFHFVMPDHDVEITIHAIVTGGA